MRGKQVGQVMLDQPSYGLRSCKRSQLRPNMDDPLDDEVSKGSDSSGRPSGFESPVGFYID